MSLTICIAGYYGVQNTGDDLLLQEVWNLWPAAEVNVLCKDSIALKAELPQAEKASDFAQVSGWQDARGLPTLVSEGAKRLLDKSDILIVGGGGLLGNGNVFAAPEVFYAKSIEIPVMLMGMGVNPFAPADVPLLRPYFRAVDAITTRDHWSWHNLRPFHEDTRCVAATCPANGTQQSRLRSELIPIVLSHSLRWARGDAQRVNRISKQVNAMTAALRDLDQKYVFYAFSPRQKGLNDVQLFEDFQPALQGETTLVVPKNVPEVVEHMSAAPFVIGDRFHALVLACRFRRPFVGMAMDSKQREISMEAGMPWFYPHKDNEKRAAHAVYSMVEQKKLPRGVESPWVHRRIAEELLA